MFKWLHDLWLNYFDEISSIFGHFLMLIKSTKYKVQGTRHKVQSTKYKVQSTKYKVQSTKYKVQSTKYKVQKKYQLHIIRNYLFCIYYLLFIEISSNLLSWSDWFDIQCGVNNLKNSKPPRNRYN
jgi:hypothetical protein